MPPLLKIREEALHSLKHTQSKTTSKSRRDQIAVDGVMRQGIGSMTALSL